MKLLLSGGGDPEHVIPLDEFFAKYVGNGKVLYIPVAMDKIPYDKCFEWFKSTYNKLGVLNVDMCTDLNNCVLDGYKAIFIGGGNTFKLLKEIKDVKFDIKLIKYLEQGGFVYGGSAGAIIFGKSIDTSSHDDKNNVGLKDLSGLNVLNDYKIWCHYNKEKDDNNLQKISGKVIVLYEESGLLYDGKKLSSLGKEYFDIEN